MLEQIDRDVKRTHPDMHFFSGDDPSAVAHRQVLMNFFCQLHADAVLARLDAAARHDCMASPFLCIACVIFLPAAPCTLLTCPVFSVRSGHVPSAVHLCEAQSGADVRARHERAVCAAVLPVPP